MSVGIARATKLSERISALNEAAYNDHTMAEKKVANPFAAEWTTKSKSHADDPK